MSEEEKGFFLSQIQNSFESPPTENTFFFVKKRFHSNQREVIFFLKYLDQKMQLKTKSDQNNFQLSSGVHTKSISITKTSLYKANANQPLT